MHLLRCYLARKDDGLPQAQAFRIGARGFPIFAAAHHITDKIGTAFTQPLQHTQQPEIVFLFFGKTTDMHKAMRVRFRHTAKKEIVHDIAHHAVVGMRQAATAHIRAQSLGNRHDGRRTLDDESGQFTMPKARKRPQHITRPMLRNHIRNTIAQLQSIGGNGIARQHLHVDDIGPPLPENPLQARCISPDITP